MVGLDSSGEFDDQSRDPNAYHQPKDSEGLEMPEVEGLSVGHDLSLQKVISRVGSDCERIFANLLKQCDREVSGLLQSERASLETLIDVFRAPEQSNESYLLAAMLLKELKSLSPEKNFVVERELIGVMSSDEFAPIVRHAASVALQQSAIPETPRVLTQMLDDPDLADYSCVALRGVQTASLRSRLRDMVSSEDQKVVNRALMTLVGAPDSYVESIIEDSTNEVARGVARFFHHLNGFHVDAHKDFLIGALQQIPTSRDVLTITPDQLHDGPGVTNIPKEQVIVALAGTGEFSLCAMMQNSAFTSTPPEEESYLQHDYQDVENKGEELNRKYPYVAFVTAATSKDMVGAPHVALRDEDVEHFFLQNGYQSLEKARQFFPPPKEYDFTFDFEAISGRDDRRKELATKANSSPTIEWIVDKYIRQTQHAAVLDDHLQTVQNGRFDRPLLSPDGELRPGDMVEIIASPKESREVRYSDAKVLQTVKHLPECEEGQVALEQVLLQTLDVSYSAYTRHAASLALQGTTDPVIIKKLGDMLQEDKNGDFAAVALRSASTSQAVDVIRSALKDPDVRVQERGLFACLGAQHEGVYKAFTKYHRRKSFLKDSIFTNPVSYLLTGSITSAMLDKVGLFEPLSNAIDTNDPGFLNSSLLEVLILDSASSDRFAETVLDFPLSTDLLDNDGEADNFICNVGGAGPGILASLHGFYEDKRIISFAVPGMGLAVPGRPVEAELLNKEIYRFLSGIESFLFDGEDLSS